MLFENHLDIQWKTIEIVIFWMATHSQKVVFVSALKIPVVTCPLCLRSYSVTRGVSSWYSLMNWCNNYHDIQWTENNSKSAPQNGAVDRPTTTCFRNGNIDLKDKREGNAAKSLRFGQCTSYRPRMSSQNWIGKAKNISPIFWSFSRTPWACKDCIPYCQLYSVK